MAPTLWFALPAAAAVAPIGLGTASSFSVLAGAGITNTGPTTMWGDAGTFATTSESGFGTVTILGTNHGGDAVTQQAKNDLTTAYNQAAASAPPTNVADELGGLTLTPGVYDGAALQLTGTLTLDTLGDPNAVFVFRTGSTLITASSSDVIVLGGGVACNVFWQVPSSATLGTASHLIGTVMASTSITANTGATIVGRLLASTGAVTLDSNTLTNTGCADSTMSTTT
ncbi:MAG TPA: ice-binding family protein, partial [Microthrixaceae bacterium]|nr:ice-binding family protein [Microthrixaceae bacterium]